MPLNSGASEIFGDAKTAQDHRPRALRLARHAGHVDIMREQHDKAIGLRRANTNISDDYDWPAYITS
nr:DinB family protein [Micromonospora acroterricola]